MTNELLKLKTDPAREGNPNHEATGIYVRAWGTQTDHYGSFDIAELDRQSLIDWLRSRGGNNYWAESTVLIMLAHEGIKKEEATELSLLAQFQYEARKILTYIDPKLSSTALEELPNALAFYSGLTMGQRERMAKALLAAHSMLNTVAECGSHQCEDCREAAAKHRDAIGEVLRDSKISFSG